MAFWGIEGEEPIFMNVLIKQTFDSIKVEVIQRKRKNEAGIETLSKWFHILNSKEIINEKQCEF